MSEETWKPVTEEGFEHLYEVSNLGRVRRTANGRVRKLSIDDGYLVVKLCNGPLEQRFFVHRLVALAFIANPDNKPEVNHVNGEKTNNRADLLEWSTTQENIDHARRIGLTWNPRKLSDEDVAIILREYITFGRGRGRKGNREELAQRFGVNVNTITNVARYGHRCAATGC